MEPVLATLIEDDEEVPAEKVSLQEETTRITPINPESRIFKTNYALAEKSPGADHLRSIISGGSEQELRNKTAMEEDDINRKYKYDMITYLAKQHGGALPRDVEQIVLGLTYDEMKSDPNTILEKKFADRYIGQVLSELDHDEDKHFETSIQARDATQDIQLLQRVDEELEAKWQRMGWWDATTSVAGQVMPHLPWYRQADAFPDRPYSGAIWMGTSVRQNVQYWWSQPPEKRMQLLMDAVKKFESEGKILDAQKLVRSLISYTNNDEFLDTAVSLADYTVGASLWGKLLGKAFKSGAKAPAPGKSVLDDFVPPPSGRTPGNALPEKSPQLDLFPPSDQDQGRFVFNFTKGDAPTPRPSAHPEVPDSGVIRGPVGGRFAKANIRDSEHPGGVTIPHNTPEDMTQDAFQFRGQGGRLGPRFSESTETMRQGDLTLEDQGRLDLGRRTPTVEEKYAQSSKTPRDPNNDLPNPPDTQKDLDVKHGIRDAVKAISPRNPHPVEMLSEMGNTPSATGIGVLTRLKKGHDIGLRDLAVEIPSMTNPWRFYDNAKLMAGESIRRTVEYMNRQGGDLIDTLNASLRVNRLPPAALEVGLHEANTAIRREFQPSWTSGLIDFEHLPPEANIWNIDTAVAWFGKNDATRFTGKYGREEAEHWAREIYKMGDNFVIDQDGNSYRIGYFKHIDETSPNVRAAMTLDPENQTDNSIIKRWLNRVLGADTLLPKFQRENRKIATHAMQEMRKQIADVVDRDIRKALSSKEKAGLNKVLIENRDGPSKTNPSERGFWHETSTDFAEAYLHHNGEMPSPATIKAYDTFKRMNDLDWLIRNIFVYRDKARQGAEQFQIKGLTGWFEGVQLEKMPWAAGKSDHDAGLWIYDPATNKGTFRYMFDMSSAERQALDKQISGEGFRVIQIFDPTTDPLKGIAKRKDGADLKDRVNFIITNNIDKSALSWKQVEYRAGGHVVYPGRWYISQPVIQAGRKGGLSYLGDNNILNVMTRAEAEKWAGRLNEIRTLIRNGAEEAAEEFRAKHLAMYTREDIQKLFLHRNAPLSLDHPVSFKEAGRNTIDTAGLKNRYPELIDTTKDPYDLTNTIDKSFLTDRDNIMKTVYEDGMVTRLVDAEQMDPFMAMDKALGQSLRGLWMNDYKISAAETFIKDFADVLKPKASQLEAQPLYWLFHAEPVAGADDVRRTMMQATQRTVLNFIGHQTELGRGLTYTNEKLLSTIYGATGQSGIRAFEKIGNFADRLGLGSIKDPVQFLRAAAFHTNLGLFNPVQLMVQMQSLSHVVGVAGFKNGSAGVAAAIFARFIAHNPEHIATFAKKAAAFGWKEADFKEMIEALNSTGLRRVAGEAVLRDDVFDPKIFRSASQAFLDKGSIFFNEGERMVRIAAFATAYKEWRGANAGAKLTQRAMGQIMERGDTLSVNMTRASSASWQTGLLSVPTQFFAFNARLLEQFLGNRLTKMEKVRALATYSTLYGLPATAGILTMGTSPLGSVGLPTSYEDIQQEALRRGYDMSPAYLHALNNGLLSLALNWATGKEYNTAERFGPGVSTALSNLMRDDKGMIDILLGASGTILKDIVKTMHPLQYAAATVFAGADAENYPVTASDVMTVFRNIKSVDTTMKAYGAYRYGQWVTKSGSVVLDKSVDGMDAALALAGLTPAKVGETYRKLSADKEDTKFQNALGKDALENYRDGMAAASRGDTALAQKHFQRARAAIAWGDFTMDEKARLYREGVKQTQALADKIDWQFIQRAPASQYMPRLQEHLRK
jgi:hypothetical protein